MNRSESIGDLVTALSKAQGQFTPVPKKKTAIVKTRTGGEYKYQYADLADCLSMALPILSANGIAFSQPHLLIGGKLRVTTLLMHSSGQWMQSDGIEISEDGDPQQFGSESTYFRRYDGCSFIGIAPDEDTDGAIGNDDKQKRKEVYAEVDRQKATKTFNAVIEKINVMERESGLIPPELDWSYNKASGVLICRILDAKKTTKKDGKGEVVTIKINNKINNKATIYYFHSSFVELLLNAIGKVVKLSVIEKGDFVNVDDVLEVDGAKVPHNDKPESTEVQARLLASQMDFTEDDLSELLTRFCSGNWAIALDKLKEEKVRRESEVVA